MTTFNYVCTTLAAVFFLISAKPEQKSCPTEAAKVTNCVDGATFGCACHDTLYECRNRNLVEASKCPVDHFVETKYGVCVHTDHVANTTCAIPKKKKWSPKETKPEDDSKIMETVVHPFTCDGRDMGRYAFRPCGTIYFECERFKRMVMGRCPEGQLYNHYTDRCSKDCWVSLKRFGYPKLVN
uniref:Chitin-binding type-2 domain-containing protein n=1 Tax=Panagrellus redivivus TaxID=6233 RepID=A0A7E4VLC1_PANRE